MFPVICSKYLYICSCVILIIFVFTSCQSIDNSIYNSNIIDTDIGATKEKDIDILYNKGSMDEKDLRDIDDFWIYYSDLPIPITSYKDLNLDDFIDNPNLSPEENEHVKRSVIDFVFYMHGFKVDNDVFLAVDGEASKHWFEKWFMTTREGWSLVDEIELHRSMNRSILIAIDGNFMMKQENPICAEQLHVYVAYYSAHEDDIINEGGRRWIYNFEFKKIDGIYKAIGLRGDT